jgi:hypothetical protein
MEFDNTDVINFARKEWKTKRYGAKKSEKLIEIGEEFAELVLQARTNSYAAAILDKIQAELDYRGESDKITWERI